MVILENMVNFSSITVYFCCASQLKGSNRTSKFIHALHPETVDGVLSFGMSPKLWSSMKCTSHVMCFETQQKCRPGQLELTNGSFKYLLYNISFQSDHSLNDLLSWVFRGPGMREDYTIS